MLEDLITDMSNWQRALFEQSKFNAINLLIDGQNFLLFFEYEGCVFGAPEPSRLNFVNMKTKTEEDNKEMNFTAVNLSAAVVSKPMQHLFYHNDLDKITVLSKDEAMQELEKQIKSTEQ